jgi:hypothetical protein
MATAKVLHPASRRFCVLRSYVGGGDRCGVAGAWALRMLPSAIMPSRWSCLSSQILNQNVMRLQQLARGVLDGGYCKLVGSLRL